MQNRNAPAAANKSGINSCPGWFAFKFLSALSYASVGLFAISEGANIMGAASASDENDTLTWISFGCACVAAIGLTAMSVSESLDSLSDLVTGQLEAWNTAPRCKKIYALTGTAVLTATSSFADCSNAYYNVLRATPQYVTKDKTTARILGEFASAGNAVTIGLTEGMEIFNLLIGHDDETEGESRFRASRYWTFPLFTVRALSNSIQDRWEISQVFSMRPAANWTINLLNLAPDIAFSYSYNQKKLVKFLTALSTGNYTATDVMRFVASFVLAAGYTWTLYLSNVQAQEMFLAGMPDWVASTMRGITLIAGVADLQEYTARYYQAPSDMYAVRKICVMDSKPVAADMEPELAEPLLDPAEAIALLTAKKQNAISAPVSPVRSPLQRYSALRSISVSDADATEEMKIEVTQMP